VGGEVLGLGGAAGDVGAGEVVGAPDQPGLIGAGVVGVERRGLEPGALGRLDVGEAHAAAGDLRPVDGSVVVRDVDAGDAGGRRGDVGAAGGVGGLPGVLGHGGGVGGGRRG